MKSFCKFCNTEVEQKNHISKCPRCGGELHQKNNLAICACCGKTTPVIPKKEAEPSELSGKSLIAAKDRKE